MQYLKALALSVLAIIAPVKPMLISALVLCLFDMVFGIGAAVKQKKRITSQGFGRTLIKITVYEASLIVGFVTQTYMLDNSLPVANLIAGLIGLVELKSILENLDIISGNSFFKSIIDKLGSKSAK